MPPKTTRNKSFVELPPIRDFCTQIDAHGFNWWYAAKNRTSRIAWTLFLTLALLALSYELYRSFHEFYTNPILTSYALIPQEFMKFPKVYICPMSFINYTYAEENKKDLHKVQIFAKGLSLGNNETLENVFESRRFLDKKSSTIEKLKGIGLKIPTNPVLTSISGIKALQAYHDDILNIGFSLDEFLKECAFKYKKLDCSKIAEPVFDRRYGKCFAIDVRDNYQDTPNHGLSLVIDVHTELGQNRSQFVPFFDGIMISVDHEIGPAQRNRIFVSPGTYTKVGIATTKFHLATIGYADAHQTCTDNLEMEILNVSRYQREYCRFDCMQRSVLKHCKCLLGTDIRFIKANLSIKPAGFCMPSSLESCVENKVYKNYSHEISSCNQRCYMACDNWEFNLDASSVKFPSEEILQRDKTASRFANNIIILDVAFSNLEYTEIRQSPSMTVDTFIGNLGGQMGIWLGASLITIVQSLTFLVTQCDKLRARAWKKRKQSEKGENINGTHVNAV